MRVQLSRALQASIYEEVQGTYPNEGGGFLLGQRDGDTVRIRDVLHIENSFESEEQYHRYAMTPQNWAKMEDEADARGLTLVGYHHSHPDAPAIPSEYDRVHALPNFVYIITSVQQGRAADQRVWLLQADRSKFEAVDLHISGE